MPSDCYFKNLNLDFLTSYLELVNNEQVHLTTNPGEEFTPFTKEKITEWLSTIHTLKNRADFAIIEESTDEFIGEVVLNNIEDGVANIRIAILPKFFDKGFGTLAMRYAIEYGFRELNLRQIELGVFDINPRAIRVYTKIGFKETHREQQGSNTSIQMKLEKSGYQR